MPRAYPYGIYDLARNRGDPTTLAAQVEKIQVPFGWDFGSGRLVKNAGEQQVIRLIRQFYGSGESLRAIARELNRRLVPTKNAGLWQATTVAKILRRLESRITL